MPVARWVSRACPDLSATPPWVLGVHCPSDLRSDHSLPATFPHHKDIHMLWSSLNEKVDFHWRIVLWWFVGLWFTRLLECSIGQDLHYKNCPLFFQTNILLAGSVSEGWGVKLLVWFALLGSYLLIWLFHDILGFISHKISTQHFNSGNHKKYFFHFLLILTCKMSF